MEETAILDENWRTLLTLFPDDWESMARTTGAISRKMRNFSSAESIMRTLLLHIAKGYSLRETVVLAKAAGFASVSDVALLKRLRCSENWFKALCCSLLDERDISLPTNSQRLNIRLVDGTVIKEPGKTGSQWRLHYCVKLPNFQCDYFELTPSKGDGSAETLQKIPLSPNDCLIADRGFSYASDIQYVSKQNAFVIVRVNTHSLPFYSDNKAKKRFSLLNAVKKLKETGETRSWAVYVKSPNSSDTQIGRLCVIRKSEHAIQVAIKKLRRKASKQQHKLMEQTLEFAKYVIVFTTLPKQKFTAKEILDWYRVRWQIELVFKRFKSLANLGHLPKYDEKSSRAWLYGKLFVCLLTEKLARHAGAISPWGYGSVPGESN